MPWIQAKEHDREEKARVRDTKCNGSQNSWSQKYIYISNDPTSTKVEERAEEHIQTSQLGNIITTSYYRIPAMVRSTSQI
jgi:hypothetical protein